MTHTLGAFHRVNFIDLDALGDGLVRTFRLANIAIDAFFCDDQCQVQSPVNPN